ncbi:MAG: amidase [Deltaproteobacteria bacterium]|nr:amidase [Deltaproteobacteria bacterium]
MHSFGDHDALGLAELVRDGEVTPLELVEAAISNIEEVNGDLNAVVIRMYDEARRVAGGDLPDGPFRGVPFLLKNLLSAYSGVRLTGGSRYYADYVPDHDAELVKRYKRAGLVVVGKTNTPELGIVPFTEPELHGPTHTPWKLGYNSGGSSGGAGAAVGAGVVPAAHGGDGGGSIRIPAACCGVFGFKPTRARTPTGPDASEHWYGFAIEHALTRSVRDSAALLDATTGPEVGNWYAPPPVPEPFLDATRREPRKLRVAFTTDPLMPSKVHPDCVTATERMAQALEDLGHHVEEARPPVDASAFARDFLTVVSVATATEAIAGAKIVGRPATKDDFEVTTWLAVMMGRNTGAVQFALALENLKTLSRTTAPFFEDYDVLLTPTLGGPPPKIGALKPKGFEATLQRAIVRGNLAPLLKVPGAVERVAEEVYDFVPFTIFANVTGQPSMNVPFHWNDDGLPIGTMLTGRFGDDWTLLSLAAQLEEAHPWANKRPPINTYG